MRPNEHGIRHLKSRTRQGCPTVYFWNPPAVVRGKRGFEFRTLGTDRDKAFRDTEVLNYRLSKYIERKFGKPKRLSVVKPMSAAWLARQFEESPKFKRYATSTQKEYSRLYRKTELFKVDGNRHFGNVPFKSVTSQMAYSMYEQYTDGIRKLRTAAMMIEAWSVAFNYARYRLYPLAINPFLQVDKHSLRPRRQRWSYEQIDSFVKTAHRLGEHSIALCALMCMELMQRPCEIRSLKWESLLYEHGYIRIVQSKRGAEVIVPPTVRLRRELKKALARLGTTSIDDVRNQYICPTKTGKRWQKRNLARDARKIGRAAGIPDALQLRDLRRTAATEAASAGATTWELMAVGGWQNANSIKPYFVRTPEHAASAQAKREAYRTSKGRWN